jgi:hypothetical protein
MLATFPGISEDGHQEEGGTVKASQGEIWYQHRSPKISVFAFLFWTKAHE